MKAQKLICKKCGSKYNWETVQSCIMPACKELLVAAKTEENFYTIQYTKPNSRYPVISFILVTTLFN